MTLTNEELERYGRHLTLPGVGLEGQAKLKAARVAVVGAGGLGSPVSLYLAAAGVGTIGLIEFDVVDASNLQRQILYAASDVGRSKLEAATERLRALNQHVTIVPHGARLTSQNALEVLAAYDVVVDGTDNFPTRYLLNDACALLGMPFVYGSIFRFEGQISVFDPARGGCYRCLFREPPPPGLVPSCAEAGVFGVLPGIVGSVQALEAIKLILGIGETLVGRLLLFDALALTWREMKLRANPKCPAGGENRTITHLIDYEEFCGMTENQQPERRVGAIDALGLKERLDRGDDITIIDVREPFEWEIGNLAPQGARLIPMKQVLDRLDEIDPAADIVVHCRSGSRSRKVAEALIERGYTRVANLEGGILGWAEHVDPSIPRY